MRLGSQLGIHWNFFVYMMLFMLMLIILLWSFQIVFFEEIYKVIKINETKNAANAIMVNLDQTDDKLDTLAERIAQDYEVCMYIFNAQGDQVISKHYRLDCAIHRMDDLNISLLYLVALRSGGEKLTFLPQNDFRYLRYSVSDYFGDVPSEDSGRGEGIIYTRVAYSPVRDNDFIIIMNTTISPVGSTVRTLRTELILISVIMTIAALGLSLLLARRVANPIIRINSGAKLLAEGNYNVRFRVSGYREIVELSETLSYAAEELSKTEKLQRELIANISHDLRTPLTMIEGYAEMMRDIPGENTPENMQIIIDETKRLSSLVNDVLDISRLQTGTQQLSLEDFNLTETIREVIGRFSKLTEQDGWTIQFNFDTEVTVNADRTRILQVIYNFINNAITHSGGDKLVIVNQRVIRRADKNSVRIEVIDHGEGIAPENLPYIWDRYYKVDKLHRRAQTGSGLGLSIVKSILELHGARYGVESKLGEGSTFWFEL